MDDKGFFTRAEVQFWVTIISGVILTLASFFNLRIEVVQTQKDVVVIKDNITEIKEDLRDILKKQQEKESFSKK